MGLKKLYSFELHTTIEDDYGLSMEELEDLIASKVSKFSINLSQEEDKALVINLVDVLAKTLD